MAMAMGIVGCAWDARTTMGTSGWSVLPYHQEATQLSSRRCRCLMLCTRICVSKAGQWKVTITTTTWEAAWPIRPTESGAGSSVLNSWRFRVHLQARKLLKLSSPPSPGCRCLLLSTRICVSKAGPWKVTITNTT